MKRPYSLKMSSKANRTYVISQLYSMFQVFRKQRNNFWPFLSPPVYFEPTCQAVCMHGGLLCMVLCMSVIHGHWQQGPRHNYMATGQSIAWSQVSRRLVSSLYMPSPQGYMLSSHAFYMIRSSSCILHGHSL